MYVLRALVAFLFMLLILFSAFLRLGVLLGELRSRRFVLLFLGCLNKMKRAANVYDA